MPVLCADFHLLIVIIIVLLCYGEHTVHPVAMHVPINTINTKNPVCVKSMAAVLLNKEGVWTCMCHPPSIRSKGLNTQVIYVFEHLSSCYCISP